MATLSGRTSEEQFSRKHIFVVHATPDMLDVMRQFLQAESYNVTTTNPVPLTFDTIETAQPSLLVVDLVIGEQFGWDLVERLRESSRTSAIPLLLISTSPSLLDRAREEANGNLADYYLSMPFDMEDLVNAVREAIGHA